MAIPGNVLTPNTESIETDTSDWSALSNADSLTRVSGGTAGSWCLRWRAILAGGSQVTIAAPVEVTAGQEYFAFASVFPPAIGAQSRIEIRWYNSVGTIISTTMGPNISAPSATWHQVAAVGTAPATATNAFVVIRSVATADAQLWYTDRIFLGLTTPATGTLLPWNVESMEVDASGWTAVTNCSVGVATSAYMFYQGLSLTSTASGPCAARTATSYPVTPGTEYVAYAYVTPGTAGLTQKIQIEWLDGSAAVLSTTSVDWTPSTGSWTRCVAVGTAPSGAATARVVLAPQATAAGQQWVYDRIALAPSSALMVAGNLLPYNTSDLEVDVSGWTVTGGTKTRSAEQALGGAYSMKLVADGGDLVVSVTTTSVQGGYGYQWAPCLYQATPLNYETRIEWLDAGGTVLRTRWQSWASSGAMWVVARMGDLAPDGAVSARLSLTIPAATAGHTVYFDRAEWVVGGLTVKAVEAASGGGVALTVRGLTTSVPTWKWSLHRIVTGQPTSPVRGWTGDLVGQTITGDVAVATDYEAPLGVVVQWRATITDHLGIIRASYLSDPVTLAAETTDVWLKDPGLPQRSTRVTVVSLPTWTTEARQGINSVRGRARPVVISDVRGAKTGDLTVVTETLADREALRWVLEPGSPLLIQWPPGWGEDDIYVSVGSVQAAPVVDFAEVHDRTWVLPLTEVDRPIGGVTGSAERTWETVRDDNDTWADVLAGASSWLDVYTGS